VAAHFEDGQNMVGIVFCFQVENERWNAQHAKSGCGKDGAFQTMRRTFAKDDAWRPCRGGEVIWQFVEKSLDSDGRFERSKLAEFR